MSKSLTAIQELLNKKQELEIFHKASTYFPKNGKFRRELYPKHMEFAELTNSFRDCAIMSGNRLGKTTLVNLIACQWLTGTYYQWFKGFRFDKPVQIMVLCDTNQNLRDVWSKIMLGRSIGDKKYEGGFIETEDIIEVANRPNTGGLVDYALIKNCIGGHSTVYFRSYEQARESFNGYTLDAVVFDEEPPKDIHDELVTRLMTTNGRTLYSFTPLKGMSEVTMMIDKEIRLPPEQRSMGVVRISMYDVPHISKDAIESGKKRWSRMEWDARIYGIPSAGKGIFFPVPDDEIACKPFKVPGEWARFMGFDYGFRRSAAVYFAIDPNTNVIYLYDLLVMKESTPADHIYTLKRRGGGWIPGASETALIMDSGKSRLEFYQEEGLNLFPATEAKKPGNLLTGIDIVYQMLLGGEVKVFSNLGEWFAEKASYHLTDKMKVTDLPHDLMDATRYGLIDGRNYADINPDYTSQADLDYNLAASNVGRNSVTGY